MVLEFFKMELVLRPIIGPNESARTPIRGGKCLILWGGEEIEEFEARGPRGTDILEVSCVKPMVTDVAGK